VTGDASPTHPAPTTAPLSEVVARRPKRADARRNHDDLLAAARDAFATDGIGVSLEEIARRAGVGIGTLYRHFPTRRELLEAVYVHEVEALCHAALDLVDVPPWEALETWLQRFIAYTATKRAILEELAAGSPLFSSCFEAILAAGEPMLRRAQDAGLARSGITFDDVLRLISGITMMPYSEPEQRDRVVGIAIDGLRPRHDGPHRRA
jgi:AcrR family transcriptional regulator